ncbi:hypothetical protein OPIT5_03670 [Opitutaceae bacterium TAV5]|nr:hypothetical protein OPIT5_03670 [Opitutaceae bacterium TAV5]
MKTSFSIPRPGALLLLVSGLLAGALVHAQSVIVNDMFTGVSGSAQNGAALGNYGWYFFNTSADGYAWRTDTAPGDATRLSGTVLSTTSGSRANTFAFRPFEPVTLGSIGESIILELDFRSAGGTAGQLIVGLLDLATPPATTILGGGQKANPLVGATGVEYSQFLYSYSERVYRYGTYSLNEAETGLTGMSVQKAGDYISVGDNVDHHLVFTLTVVSTGLQVSASITETDGSTTTLANYVIESEAGSYTFDTLRLSTQGISSPVYFDNIVISTTAPIPEPAVTAAVAGAVLLAIALALRCRRQA